MITLGGKTDTELGFKILSADTLISSLPATRDYTAEIAGRHGSWDFGADLQAKMFVFNCWLLEDMIDADIDAAITTLNEHLLDGWGKPSTLELVFDYQTGRHYNVRYSGAQGIDTGQAIARRKFTLPLIAFDPYAYGVEVEDEDTIVTSGVSLLYVVASGYNVPIKIIMDNEGANTLKGFSFKTFEVIEDWSYYDPVGKVSS